MKQLDWKTLIRPHTVDQIMGAKTNDAVFAAKVEAAHVLADEIKRRKAAVEALKAFVNYEPWMDRHADDVQVGTFKRHTFGDLRKAKKIIDNGRHNQNHDVACQPHVATPEERDMSDPYEMNVHNLRRRAQAVYLACEAPVADDISASMKWAADEIDLQRRRVTALEMIIREELPPLSCGCDANRMLVEGIHGGVGGAKL